MAVVWVAKPIGGSVNDVVGRREKEIKELEQDGRREAWIHSSHVYHPPPPALCTRHSIMETAVNGRDRNLCPEGAIVIKVWI